jgi:hypothetical protein
MWTRGWTCDLWPPSVAAKGCTHAHRHATADELLGVPSPSGDETQDAGGRYLPAAPSRPSTSVGRAGTPSQAVRETALRVHVHGLALELVERSAYAFEASQSRGLEHLLGGNAGLLIRPLYALPLGSLSMHRTHLPTRWSLRKYSIAADGESTPNGCQGTRMPGSA